MVTSRKICLRSQVILGNFAAVTNPANRLIEVFGTRAGIAKRFKISPEAARLWLKDGIPTDRALEVEAATAAAPDGQRISALEVLKYAKAREDAKLQTPPAPAASPA